MMRFRMKIATWFRWIAYKIEGRNRTLSQCDCGGAMERPWPLPKQKHDKECKQNRWRVVNLYGRTVREESLLND